MDSPIGLRPSKVAFDRLVEGTLSFDGTEKTYLSKAFQDEIAALAGSEGFPDEDYLGVSACKGKDSSWKPLATSGA